jgi:hypothetical protein
LSVVTPAMIRLTSNSSMAAPPVLDDYLFVSGSDQPGNVCVMSSNGTLTGQVVCRGGIDIAANLTLNGNIISTNGNVTLASNVTVHASPGLSLEVEIPVKPLVWADGAF